jgi:hypothetical protein
MVTALRPLVYSGTGEDKLAGILVKYDLYRNELARMSENG